ncbi:MAG: SbcC/MukB-like Walker B domain-containing protein [Bacteroidota bacterium]
MNNLFTTSSSEAGFRLQYMELYNWGTFDGHVFRINPRSNNSLLTGANGSGKTTFVDALVTLLVPLKKDRFYNQSSGVEKKGDRTEESYILGHYGNIQKEGELSARTQSLRKKDTYSVLLASFSNQAQKTITLFQVRYFSNGQLKRVFGIAHRPLEITKDFSNFDNRGNWRRQLDKQYNQNSKRRQIEFSKGPTDYAQRMIQLFGMRTDRALNLFNQVVGIKVLGDLDEFIRTNMLEWRDAENEYLQLKDSFVTLMNAKNNIDKAKEQIAQLKPIDKMAKQLEEATQKFKAIQLEKELAVFWFATKGKELATLEMEQLANQVAILEENIDSYKTEQEELREKATNLAVQIETDTVGRQIRELGAEIRRLEKQRDTRQSKLKDYTAIADKINFAHRPTEEIFYEQRERAKGEKQQCEAKKEREMEQLRLAKNEQDELANQIQIGVENIKTLRLNKNNISGRVAEIRMNILEQVGATKEEIPFIGELIRVDESAKDWEGSIEKVLHNFALRLIVPEKYYYQVNKYVNSTNLRGRITYQRYKPTTNLKNFQVPTNKKALIHKLSFKPRNPYKDWVEQQISTQFNYICAENLGEFNQLEKAMTRRGLIKFGRGKHEKDDRRHILSKENYVLGWDNTEKLAWWRQEIKRLREQETSNGRRIRNLQQNIRDLDVRKDNFYDLYKLFTKYDEIHWQHYAEQVQTKREQLKVLEATNDKVKALQEQLKDVKVQIKEKERQIDTTKDQKRRVEIGREQAAHRLQQYEQTLVNLPEPVASDLTTFEQQHAQLQQVTYENLPSSESSLRNEKANQLRRLDNQKAKLKEQLIPKISAFKNPNESIVAKFKTWRMDVYQLPDSVEYVQAYQQKYEELKAEDLPKYEKKFNEYLEETIINKVADFKFFFDRWVGDIKDNIKALNEALKAIDFNNVPKTYIQLVSLNRPKADIDEFNQLLYKSIPNFKELDASIDGKRRHFERHIQPLIEKLADEKWRTKVMKVRTWFEYRAEEFYSENDQKFKTYSGMGQLSGGEKAQLTYTILGSAIAYQFGLTQAGMNNNSFRFIAIDEAFKAQDEDKAQYLMKLCKQLHLQLLVVTPSDNLHIVEPHISFVHYVERRNDRNSWLYDMPIQQFQDERERYDGTRVEVNSI